MRKFLIVFVVITMVAFLFGGCFPVKNLPPIITSDPVKTATVGVEYTYDVDATDPDDDVLTYSLTTKPTGMDINSATGLIKWTSTTKGDYAVIVKVSDGDLDIIQSFTIVVGEPEPEPVENNPPEIISSAVTSAKVGEAYTYGVEATDPEGDILTYSLTERPIGMSIVATTGIISWIPTDAGVFGVGVKVSDPDGLFDVQSFNITVADADEPEPEPELVLVGIEVDPKTMTLFKGEVSEPIEVTGYYEFRSYGVILDPAKCLFLTSDKDIATVSKVGEVKAVAKGTATILVGYEGKVDTLEVTVEGAITITWFEDAERWHPDGTYYSDWQNDPLGPATLIEDNGGWRFADIFDYFNIHVLPDTEGSVVIDDMGKLSGWATYTLYELPTENIFVGQVEIIVYEDGTSGTMVGTYTQFKYAFGTETDILGHYPKAVECAEEGKWFVQYTDYIAYPR